mmetsp:Transcript_47055/g.106092  ORF Transcript_47055/g.106092 Transcript_47055/m.106092 type:complete len:268 (+) Transcript_47055:115-918(+)
MHPRQHWCILRQDKGGIVTLYSEDSNHMRPQAQPSRPTASPPSGSTAGCGAPTSNLVGSFSAAVLANGSTEAPSCANSGLPCEYLHLLPNLHAPVWNCQQTSLQRPASRRAFLLPAERTCFPSSRRFSLVLSLANGLSWSNSTHAWPMLPFSLILGSITAMYPPPSGSLPNRSGSSTNLLLISITDPRTQAYTLKELSSSIVTVQIMSLGDMKIAPPFFLPDTSASIRFFESCVRNATFFTTRGGCIIGCDFEIPRMQSPLECTWRC